MKIKEVAIENFKCFKEATFQLGKLTLLTGTNSSGKSSVLYSILGALQSGEFPFQFSPNGKYAYMGNFEEISHLRIFMGTGKSTSSPQVTTTTTTGYRVPVSLSNFACPQSAQSTKHTAIESFSKANSKFF